LNLNTDGVAVKEAMNIRWIAETGLVENIDQMVKDYKEARNLKVIIVIYVILYIVPLSLSPSTWYHPPNHPRIGIVLQITH